MKFINIEVYWDSECTDVVSDIGWDTLKPGNSVTKTIYIKNTGNDALTLNLTYNGWIPIEARDYITLSWNKEGAMIDPDAIVGADLMLSISESISGITNFSFNIIIVGKSEHALEIIVDDTEAGFVGSWGGPSTAVSGYWGDGYRHHTAGTGVNTATWTPDIPEAGTWEVFARWTSYGNRATDAPYTISHAGGPTTVRVNQETDGGTWYSLGTYTFDAGAATITLSDDADGYVIADAINLVYIG